MTAQSDRRPVIVAFGDSITYGYQLPRDATWVHRLGELLADELGDASPELINAGVNGHTSRQGLARIDADVLAHRPTLVLVEFGGNDTIEEPARHVTLDEFRLNLREIHRQVTGVGGRTVFFSFPPVVNDWHPNGRDVHYTATGGMDAYVDRYRQATREEAAALGRPFYDFDGMIRRAAERSSWEAMIAPDGVHLTRACNEVVARELVQPVLEWLRA